LSSLALPSFAKTNWILKILGLREDGFHELRTVVQMLDLKDRLDLRVTAEPEIRIQVRGRPAPSGPDNLVCRAARLLRRKAGVPSGVEMILTKRIPLGAGLGGGSGNAAMTLLGLNQLWGCGLSLSDLAELGAELGADVAFFLRGGSALGEGKGERITPLPDLRRSLDIALLYPGRGLSTKEAYSMRNWGVWDGGERLTRAWTKNTIHRFSRFRDGLDLAHLENDFETLLFQRYGFLEKARKALIALGCERVMVCGSGSTLMGLGCRVRRQREENRSAGQEGGELLFCSTLSRKRYRKLLRESGLDVRD